MLLNGAEIIIEVLKEVNTELIFGYPGGTVIPVYDALFLDGTIKHIRTAHEQGAAHAADGYARATGRTGVCLVTSGPGATNLVTGIATAYMDSVPMVALTVNVPISNLGKDSFQEVDIAGITMPVTKHNFIIKDISGLADTLRRAFRIAREGRPGPVLIDITRNVLFDRAEYMKPKSCEECAQRSEAGREIEIETGREIEREAGREIEIEAGREIESETGRKTESDVENQTGLCQHRHECEEVAQLLAKAQKPVLLVGGGAVISRADTMLRRLSDRYLIPVVETLMGKGVCSGTDRINFGMAGRFGKAAANYALQNTDLIIAVGTRFSDRVMTNGRPVSSDSENVENRKIVQIDIDKAELNKNVKVDVPIAGDAAQILSELLETFEKRKVPKQPQCRKGWIEKLCAQRDGNDSLSSGLQADDTRNDSFSSSHQADDIRNDSLSSGHQADGIRSNNVSDAEAESFTGPAAVRTVYEVTGGKATIVTEVGLNQMWAANEYFFERPGQLLTSGGLGTMGYGLGAAIGAQLGKPDELVINIAGDGCFRMNMNELLTAAEHKLPVIEIIMENDSLGMVKDMQVTGYDSRIYETEFVKAPDYASIAAALGANAITVSSCDELKSALADAINERTLWVIVCRLCG